jgi:hypothetical protein
MESLERFGPRKSRILELHLLEALDAVDAEYEEPFAFRPDILASSCLASARANRAGRHCRKRHGSSGRSGKLTILLAKIRVCSVSLVEAVLPLHDHAEVLVIDDKNLCVEALHLSGRHLLTVHEEGAIPVDINNDFLRPPVLACRSRAPFS